MGRIISSDFWMRAFALLLALVLWLVVSAPRRERLFEKRFDVPIALVGLSRDLVITFAEKESLSVRLRGRASALRSLSSQNLEATLDLTSVTRPGEVIIAIRPQALNLPAGVEVVSLDPAKASFRVEALRRKVVPIRPFPVGQLRPGYEMGNIVVFPERALISGPASLLRNVSEVATERIILTGRVVSFQTSVALVSDQPLVRIIEPLNAQVEVQVIEGPGVSIPPAEGDVSTSPPQ